MLPDFRPSIDDVRAIVTTRWGKSGYRPKPIRKIESYYVDTALDNDADTWTVDIGDPDGEFMEFAVRDNEIRAQLFGIGQEGIDFLVTGVADDASYADGTWTLTGRDFSSLATDSTVPPQQFRHVRAWAIVEMQAKLLGFRNTSLAHGKMVKKVQYTEGSESYWEFWYRLYRKEQMWLWCEPNGVLIANTLNYGNHIDYYLGDFRENDADTIKKQHMPVERLEIYKTTQSRIAEVYVFGHKGDNGFLTIVKDPTMTGWIKKPRKVMLDTESHTTAGARKTGLEEIFEGKVGSVEYKLTIADPGFRVRTNRIARVNIPSIGLFGQFFIVGTRIQAGPDGFVQEIRLREKQYAVTRRIPTDPKKITNEPGAKTASSLGAGVESNAPDMPTGWGDYFVKAAKNFHGPWDYQLFLATLMGICKQETSFRNIRQNGGPGGNGIEWYPFTEGTGLGLVGDIGQGKVTGGETRDQWQAKFANEIGDGYVSMEFGVGPMQLTSRGLKHDADDRLRTNYRNEFSGGRWHPEHSIWIAASYLRSCLKGTVADSGRDIDMWMGVMAYNRGVAGAISYFAANNRVSSYALQVKNYVYNDPGYLTAIKAAVKEAQAEAAQPANPSAPASFSGSSPFKNSASSLATLKFIQKLGSNVDLEHVDWALLQGINRVGMTMGTTIVITSGFRTLQEQQVLWDRYQKSGFNGAYIAARPGTSNHERGKACDCTIGGRAILFVAPAFVMSAAGIHVPLGSQDAVHVTRLGVSG